MQLLGLARGARCHGMSLLRHLTLAIIPGADESTVGAAPAVPASNHRDPNRVTLIRAAATRLWPSPAAPVAFLAIPIALVIVLGITIPPVVSVIPMPFRLIVVPSVALAVAITAFALI